MGMEDGDEILAVEIMDLTENIPADDGPDSTQEPSILHRQLLRKNWSTDPQESVSSVLDYPCVDHFFQGQAYA